MKIEVSLFGALRGHAPGDRVTLELAEGAGVAELRARLLQHAVAHWPKFQPALLQRSAFASQFEILRETDVLPVDGQVAVLPPVSGG